MFSWQDIIQKDNHLVISVSICRKKRELTELVKSG